MTELTVRDVTVRSVVVPLRRPLATKVGDFSRWPLLLIDVTTGQGITGRGYLAPYLSRAAAALRTVLEDMGTALRGQPWSYEMIAVDDGSRDETPAKLESYRAAKEILLNELGVVFRPGAGNASAGTGVGDEVTRCWRSWSAGSRFAG